MASLAFPFAIIAAFVWFVSVPKLLEYSETGITIHDRRLGHHAFAWSDLERYGLGNKVFGMKFSGIETFAIFPWAYPRGDWKEFEGFLRAHYPDRAMQFPFTRFFRRKP